MQDSRAWEDPEEEEADGSVDIITGRQFSQVQAAAVQQWAELEAYSADKIENTPEQDFLRAARKLQVRLLLQHASLLVPCAVLKMHVSGPSTDPELVNCGTVSLLLIHIGMFGRRRGWCWA